MLWLDVIIIDIKIFLLAVACLATFFGAGFIFYPNIIRALENGMSKNISTDKIAQLIDKSVCFVDALFRKRVITGALMLLAAMAMFYVVYLM